MTHSTLRLFFLTSSLNSNFLIGTVGDFLVDVQLAKWFFLSATIDNPLHIPLGEHGVNLAGSIVRIIPKPCIIAVGIENERTLPGHLLKAIGIKASLFATNFGVNTSINDFK